MQKTLELNESIYVLVKEVEKEIINRDEIQGTAEVNISICTLVNEVQEQILDNNLKKAF